MAEQGNEEPGEAQEKPGVVERGTAAVARAKARAEELRARAEANRPRSVVLDVAFGSYEHDVQVGGGILAGALAFRFFLFVVPLVFFIVFLFGFAADAAGRSAHDLAEDAGIAGLLASTITQAGDLSLWSRLSIITVAAFATVTGARSLMKVVTVVHILIWRLPYTRLRRQMRATGLLIAAVLGALVVSQVTSWVKQHSFPAWVIGTALYITVPAGLWLLASVKLFPHPAEVGWRDVVPGAVLVGVGIEALHVFTLVWVSNSFERKSETYGAIGGSLAVLLWAYVTGRILAAAPVLNAVVWRRTHPDPDHLAPPPVAPVLPPPPPPAPPSPPPPPPAQDHLRKHC